MLARMSLQCLLAVCLLLPGVASVGGCDPPAPEATPDAGTPPSFGLDASPTSAPGSAGLAAVSAPGTGPSRAAPPTAPAAPLPDVGLEPPPPLATTVYLDLVGQALRAHVRRVGPVVDPAGPGWARVVQLGDRKTWVPPPKGEKGALAWPEGIGATLAFPVGAEGPLLRTGSIFLKGIAANQRATLFLDEKNVSTVPVPMTGRTVTFTLPPEGLTPGEHRLRLWFRFTRFVGKLRTPGGVGPLILSPDAQPEATPARWVGTIPVGGTPHPALLAGSPSGWTFYVWLPERARFTATVVTTDSPADFRVVLQGDASDPVEVLRLHVDAHTETPLELDLARFSRQPVRLELESSGPTQPLGAAGWADAALRMPAPPVVDVPGARNVIVWAVDGLRADRVSFGKGGGRAATPNLDRLALEGGGGDEIWSGGPTAEEGHRRLLRPDPNAPSLPALFIAKGRFAGYFGGSAAVDPALVAEFTTNFDLRKTGEPPETRIILRELESWMDVRKRQPFFAYVSTTDPKQPGDDALGYTKLYAPTSRVDPEDPEAETKTRMADARARTDGQISAADYWVAQLFAMLEAQGVLKETAVVVVGTVGSVTRVGTNDNPALVPEVLRVPLVVWHPGMLGQREHGLVHGGDLVDAASTILDLGGLDPPPSWRGASLAASLFFGTPVAPRANSAQLGAVQVARLGDWWLRTSPGRPAQLWNLADDPAGRTDLAADRPIALRLIRDAMQDDRSPVPVHVNP